MMFVVTATISACASPAQRAQQLARSGGLTPLSLRGSSFQHQAFTATRGPAGLLVLFIEGDGSPWVDGGRRVAASPDARVPLALELAVATPASVLYLGRPCYLQTMPAAECSAALWTSRRYSEKVVASMTNAAAGFIAGHPVFQRVLLVGYSGGGTLAALMAKDLPHVIGLVTIAGNLDPDGWTQLHAYEPLEGMNPALEPPLSPQLKQWYLVGQRDSNVPAAATARYFARVPPERVWSYARFDHRCCWAREWPALFAKIVSELDQ